MNINQISFFNIGISKKKHQDFYDVLIPGVLILNSDDKYLFVEFIDEINFNKIKIFDYSSDWWNLAANYLMITNKHIANKKYLSGLLQCADQEDQDGLFEFANNKKEYVKFERNIINNFKKIDLFCIKQSIEDDFYFEGDRLIKNSIKINIKDIFGSFDNYETLIVYTN